MMAIGKACRSSQMASLNSCAVSRAIPCGSCRNRSWESSRFTTLDVINGSELRSLMPFVEQSSKQRASSSSSKTPDQRRMESNIKSQSRRTTVRNADLLEINMSNRKIRNTSCFSTLKVRTVFVLDDGMVIQSTITIIEVDFIRHQVFSSNSERIPKNSTIDETLKNINK